MYIYVYLLYRAWEKALDRQTDKMFFRFFFGAICIKGFWGRPRGGSIDMLIVWMGGAMVRVSVCHASMPMVEAGGAMNMGLCIEITHLFFTLFRKCAWAAGFMITDQFVENASLCSSKPCK